MMLPFSTGPVYGLKLWVKAASPDPVITRHVCASAVEDALLAEIADAPGARLAATAATAPMTPAATSRRLTRAAFLIPYPLR